MKSAYRILAVLMVLGTLFIAGCGYTGTGQPSMSADVYRGSEGIRMKFVQDTPPLQTFASTGDRFDMSLELWNYGTFPLRGKLYFSGFDPEIITFPELSTVDNGMAFPTQRCGTSTIMPRSKVNPTGGVCYEELHGMLNLNAVTDSYRANIFVQAIYEYLTDATITMCIDPDVYQVNVGSKPCIMRPWASGAGQGGPVAVTRIEPTALGDGRIMYRIHIANQGRGEVVPPNLPPYAIKPSDVGYVRYAIGTARGVSGGSVSVTSGDTSVRVSGLAVSPLTGNAAVAVRARAWSVRFDTGYKYGTELVRLQNGQGMITYIADYSTRYATQTPIKIMLSYDYMESIQQSVEIVNVKQYEPDYIPGGGGFVVTKGDKRLQIDSQGRIIYRDSDVALNIPTDLIYGKSCVRDSDCAGAATVYYCRAGKCGP